MKTLIKKISNKAIIINHLKKVGDVICVGEKIITVTIGDKEYVYESEQEGLLAFIAPTGLINSGSAIFIICDDFEEVSTEELPEAPVANTITVVKNLSTQRIVITSQKPGEKAWFIEKHARIALDTIPQWVKLNADYIAYQRDGQLAYDVLSAAKEMN